MIDERYNRLSMAERESFSRITNQLLAGTFLLAEEYDPAEGMTRVNRDYLFVERNFELYSEYLALSGFRLERDSGYGVIYLVSGYDGNRVHFDKLTTVALYTLRLIYEEERQKLHLSKEVIITTSDLVQKMISVGAVKKKPANVLLHAALRRLSRFRLIQKLEGSWEAPDTRLLIPPSILFVVSNEQISNMRKLVDEKPGRTEGMGELSSDDADDDGMDSVEADAAEFDIPEPDAAEFDTEQ